MNKWQPRVDEYKQFLEETEKWIKSSDWSDLPLGLRRVIIRGQIEIEERIKKYEQWAEEEENFKAE